MVNPYCRLTRIMALFRLLTGQSLIFERISMNHLSSPASAGHWAWRLSAISAVCTALCLSACSRQEAVQEPVRAVKLLTVGGSDLNVQGEYAAEVRARVESRLGFRVGGKLVQRQAEVGQRVNAGQVLAQIDPQDYQLGAQAAQAQVAAAQTQRDLALSDFKRYESLKAQNFISGAELERRETTLKAAEATLAQAKAQAQAQTNQANYTHLNATAPGVITGVEAEIGQVVSAGQPVVRLAQDGPRDAVFSVSEQAVLVFKPGQDMQAVLTSTGQVLKGRVREVGASADPVTRTYVVKLALDKAEKLPLGATVNVLAAQLPGSQAGALKLPTSALRQDGSATAVWVLDEASMTVRSQAVQVGAIDGNEVVIASGLKAGQKVVSAGVHVLTPGQKVSEYGAVAQPAAAAASNAAQR
jgi:RND family efflux transporter MFP subunit